MDAEYVLACVGKKKVKIPLGLYRPILDPHGFEKWNKLEVEFANLLKEKLMRKEISESEIDGELMKWSCIQIKEMEKKKRKQTDVEFMEERLNKLNEEIRSSMKEDKKKCIQLLVELQTLDLNPVILKKNPFIIDTIFMLNEYQYSLPRITTRSKMTEFKEAIEEIKQQVHNIIRKFTIMFSVPEDTSFFEFFMKEKELFHQQIKSLSLADMNDLLTSEM